MRAEFELDKKSLENVLNNFKERTEQSVVAQLAEIGKKSVEIARKLPDQGGTYHNRTGKLHNSIGYAVFKDGNVVAEDFIDPSGREAAMKKRDGSKGGFALVIVAGAEYAMDVHVRGYDVIDSAIINAEKEFQEWLSQNR